MTTGPFTKRRGPNPKPMTRAEALAAELLVDEPAIERDKEIRVGASVPVSLIRRDYELHGAKRAIETGRSCFVDGTITDEQIIAIGEGKATLRGFSDTGITYHDQRCGTCGGNGRVSLSFADMQRIARKRANPVLTLDGRGGLTADEHSAAVTGQMRCPACKGDGFGPPIKES